MRGWKSENCLDDMETLNNKKICPKDEDFLKEKV